MQIQSFLCGQMFNSFHLTAAQIRTTGDQPLRDTLTSLGGWPVLNPSWLPNDVGSVEKLLGRLRGELNQGVLVEQWVGPDDKNSSVNIIQVFISHILSLS